MKQVKCKRCNGTGTEYEEELSDLIVVGCFYDMFTTTNKGKAQEWEEALNKFKGTNETST